jgi:hypothetical protein
MDSEYYHQLKQYLINKTFQNNIPNSVQKQIITASKYHELRHGLLYRQDRWDRGKLLKVLQKHEIIPILYAMHNHPLGGHFGADIIFGKIRRQYYWPKMYESIRDYVKTCDQCQRRGKNRNREKLHPIPVESPFYQVGIDIVGPLPTTPRRNTYIVVATDYMTKWPEAKALKKADAQSVAKFIYEEIICRHGCPKYFLTDRGTHFKNQLVDELIRQFNSKHLLSTPYHPQTNGLVERFNRTLCESLAKVTTEVTDWDLYIPSVLFAYRTAIQSTTKITPFYLVYGREAKLPIDNLDDILEDNILERLFYLVNKLPYVREQAKQQVQKMQEKQKARYDAKIKKIESYQIGDKVLMYRAEKEKQWSGKLEDKWKGPYYIHEILRNGAYKLRELDGRVLKAPINGKILKRYHERQWNPIVYIDNNGDT